MITLEQCRDLDAADPLAAFRGRFALPEGTIYLDGNSLGALPRAASEAVGALIDQQWGPSLIRGWLAHGWIDAPARVGGKIARLIGAQAHEVLAADSTSVNLFKLVVGALQAQPGRRKVISEPGNFPTDLYMIQGAIGTLGGRRLELVRREALLDALDEDTALVVLTHAHYKSAELFDMAAVTARAHAVGALALWDLSHSAGALPVDLNAANADLAVGCGYKYLNGGPGAPAFLFVAERHHHRLSSPLSGWMGHARPFDLVDDYAPAAGIARFLCGTPPVLALAALEAGVDEMLAADMAAVATKSRRMCDLFIDLVAQECPNEDLRLMGPARGQPRASHVSFHHPHGYAVMQALIAAGVVGDFRAPDVLRFGLTPLYLRYADLWTAAATLRSVLASRSWDRPEHHARALVT
jgi:kynureninase